MKITESIPYVDLFYLCWKALVSIGILIVAILFEAETLASAGERAPVKVLAEKVRNIQVTQTFPVIGRFVARKNGVVAALTNGPLKEMLVEVGDRVSRGQVVARMIIDRIQANRDLLAAELTIKEAKLRTVEARLTLKLGEMVRLDGLRKSAAFSHAQYSDKRNEVAMVRSEISEAQGAVSKAKADLKLASIDLYNAEIRAPFDAKVIKRHATVGTYLSIGTPIATLLNDKEMEIEANVPAGRLVGVLPNREVKVRMDNGYMVSAVVRAIVPSENSKTRTRPVRFSLEMGELSKRFLIAESQSVTVLLPVAQALRVLTVHKDAVTTKGNNKVVVKIVDGIAKPRNVKIGESVGDRFAVLSGLSEGDTVVIRGNEGLRSGQKVIYETSAK